MMSCISNTMSLLAFNMSRCESGIDSWTCHGMMPNEQHLKRLSCCPRFCFVVTEIWTLFICNCLPIVACSEQNNGSTWDMMHLQEKPLKGIDRFEQSSFEIDMFEKDYRRLCCHTSNSIHILLSRWVCERRTAWYWCDMLQSLRFGSKQRVVIIWNFFMKFFIWRGLFHNDSVFAVYLPNTSRCWHVSDGMYNCSPYGRDLTSMDERENKWCLERYLHTQRHTLGIVCGAAALDAWIIRHKDTYIQAL